ncbi:FoF1 ATP synthase subunit B' [Campylobacter aviculae]|uniref:F0F1 ATP synthase subunit B n=1 Tax=Campylobacter aviculae TaxID=2510190 RepID=A0A4U7BSV9_9BACT|nr:FoF1 ATP synthase subunit B' [Campylobacter aviculae]TKX31904.1 F0F1 ATP synthase subunit B' [Campylobacter aviculae]
MFEDMHPSIMFATMAIFLAMIVILNTMLYKPLLKFMDERNDSIKNDENKVKENSQEMLNANDEVEAIYANTREEVYKIKQNAINAAKEEADQVIKSKKEELERKMSNFYIELENQKKEFQSSLFEHLPELKQALYNNIKQSGINR